MSLPESPEPTPDPEPQAGTGPHDAGQRPASIAPRSDTAAGSERKRKRASPAPKSLRADTALQNGFDLYERQMVWITGNTNVLIRTITLVFAVLAAGLLFVGSTALAMHALGVSPVWSTVVAGVSIVGTGLTKRRVSSRQARKAATTGDDPKGNADDVSAANR